MKIVKCKFETDRWGMYITPMLGYSNTERGKNLWFGWLKWLFTVELTNEGSTYNVDASLISHIKRGAKWA